MSKEITALIEDSATTIVDVEDEALASIAGGCSCSCPCGGVVIDPNP